jgi:CheY-like chemotaxis protein
MPDPRLLIVDDEPQIRRIMRTTLTSAGYEVDDAENGARAWKALHLEQYDLLVTDNEMPEMTGLQLQELIVSQWPARASSTALSTTS